VLPEDRGTVVSGGEEYTLKSILNKEFEERRWIETESLLNKFLSVHRSESIERRARYYLGQTLFFQGKYRDALLEFVLIRDELYVHVEPWLDVIFYRINGDFGG
ncbi:MAG: tetratricopeptide repeat protein, partial [Spirochaetia bacterium]